MNLREFLKKILVWALNHPTAAIAWASLFWALFADFMSVGTKVGESIPPIEGLLPAVYLWGGVYFSATLIHSIFTWVWPMRPSHKFSMSLNEIDIDHCKSDLVDTLEHGVLVCPLHNAYSCICEISIVLRKFSIPFPPVRISTDREIGTWIEYLSKIKMCARLGDLRAARNVYEHMEEAEEDTR